MTFDNIIKQVSSSANAQKHILTDGRFTCSYQEIPKLLEGVDAYFRNRGFRPEVCLALECVNSVPGALTLLYLLKEGYRFVLLPPAANVDGARDFKPIPHFCQSRVVVRRALNDELALAEYPERLLWGEENERYVPEPSRDGHDTGKLYLRTSGSMGTSKIAVHSHTKLLNNALNCVTRLGLKADDRITVPVPIFHMYGLGAGFLPAVAVGASVDLQDNANLLKYMDRERRFTPNIAFVTPTLCDMLLKGRRTSERNGKVFVTATQRISEATFRAFDARFGNLVNLYGSTEMGAIAACEPGDDIELRATTIGKPMAGVEMRLGETGAEADGDAPISELYCRHPHGFEGYVDENGQSMRQETRDGWYKTGDVAKIGANGCVQILGRSGFSVNRRGMLVLFSDIENAMEQIENVAQVVVVAAKGESQQGQRITAFCVPSRKAKTTASHIREACFKVLPKYAIPDDVCLADVLPTLPSGKVDRQALVGWVRNLQMSK